MKLVQEVLPDCTNPGSKAHYICTVCNRTFEDEEGLSELASDELIIPPTGHKPGDPELIVDEDGYTERIHCTVCGELLSSRHVTVEPTEGYYYASVTNMWIKGSNKNAPFRVKRMDLDEKTYDLFLGILVDGEPVSRADYEKARGSVIITLKPAYLETLSVGVHSLTAMFTDGEVSTPFIVVQPGSGSERYDYPETVYVLPSNNPRTGDDSSIMLWGTLALISALAAGSSYTLLRRRRKKTS